MNKLDKYFSDYNKTNENSEYNVFYMEAKDLINDRRIDIIVKYYYIKSRETGENLEFAKKIYEKYIEAFSDGTFEEYGNKEKDSIEKHIEIFNNLIDTFKAKRYEEDISVIPVGKNNETLDGSHRVACALYFNQRVKVIKFDDLSVDYGFEFFKNRQLDDFYLDFIAKEYVNLKKEVYALFVWPRVGKDENIRYIKETLEEDNCNIIYKKQLKLDRKELWNLIFNIYKNDHWVGHTRGNFRPVKDKKDLCYNEEGYLWVYVLDCLNLETLNKVKNILRNFFQVGKSSIHTMDTWEESVEILDIILDKDYDSILYENFLKKQDKEYTYIKHVKKKITYLYRKIINEIKNIMKSVTRGISNEN